MCSLKFFRMTVWSGKFEIKRLKSLEKFLISVYVLTVRLHVLVRIKNIRNENSGIFVHSSEILCLAPPYIILVSDHL